MESVTVFKMKKLLLIISLLIFALTACKKPGERSCFKSSGEKTSIRIDLPDFNKLQLNKHLKYILVQDDSCYLRISGGKNLLGFVRWEEKDGKITITNHNKCHFLRDLKAVCTVEIHFKDLADIAYEGSETLINRDTLQLSMFNLLILNCAGSVDLTLNADYISADVTESYGDYTLRGHASDAVLSARTNGYCNTEDLSISNTLYVASKSSGDMHINAANCYLQGYIGGNGNIYYKGLPLTTEIEYFSSGKLIPY
ncbi:MAG: hypothetical protein K0R65_648 [Crocinitomicaceae bacterium]|jgi:hypothetical protein|nr:hypothetical protein [Crocinitomicaceae bacterium]